MGERDNFGHGQQRSDGTIRNCRFAENRAGRIGTAAVIAGIAAGFGTADGRAAAGTGVGVSVPAQAAGGRPNTGLQCAQYIKAPFERACQTAPDACPGTLI